MCADLSGGIGARFASLLEAVGLRVVAWTPHPDPVRLTSPAQRFVPLPELMTSSDVVSLHLALTDDTRGMIDEPLLRAMPNVILSPHQGYNTPESLDRMLDGVVANIENYLAGRPASIVAGPPFLAELNRTHLP